MVLELNDVEITICKMDNHYNANFGSWIRNERNAAIIGHHLKKYIDDYNPCDFIVVLKWIVRSWTLRSIIIVAKSMFSDDIQSMSNSRKSEMYPYFKNRICVLSGLVFTWNNYFVAEFLSAFSRGMDISQKCKLLLSVLSYFDDEKKKALIALLDERAEKKLSNVLARVSANKRPTRSPLSNKDLHAAFAVS